MRNFRDLRVWDKAHRLALSVYRGTRSFPAEERYGLTSQIRRAASSIGGNIAEGCGRRSDPEMSRFLKIAMGSATELECHLLLAVDLGFLKKETFEAIEPELTDVKSMLAALLQRIEADRCAGSERAQESSKRRKVGS